MKKIAVRSVKILSLLLALAICIGFLQTYVLCHADQNRERVRGFYLEDKDSLDVVLIGASDVYAGFSSLYAYKNYGFTSYPVATQSNVVLSYKTQVKEAVERQHPKLIVVEINGALYGKESDLTKEANFRNYSDNIPMSYNKYELISENKDSNQLEYYLPIVKYHSVWNDFPKGLAWSYTLLKDDIRGYNYLKGSKSRSVQFKPKEKTYNDTLLNDDGKDDFSPNSEKCFRELLEYCKSENINVVFTRFPHIVVKSTYARFHRSNTAGDIISEYGFKYYNFERDFEKTGLDINKDFYNYDHLNVYGQQKFTDYFCKILTEEHGITPSDLTDSQKEEWDTCAKYYDAYYKYNVDCINNKQSKDISEYFRNIEVMEDKYMD